MAEKRWLEVSMTVDPEQAEAVSEVLSRFIESGVVVESGVTYNDAEDVGTPFGPAHVYGYLEINEQLEDTRQRLEEALWYLGRITEMPEPVFRTIEDQDWMSAWKVHYRPIPIGQRLMILPAWIDPSTTDRLPVRIDPSMAFGTGTHPTTQLCLAMLEDCVEPGSTLIDVGCGSGILSIGAVRLGAKLALGVDIEEESVKATKENAEANEVLASIEAGLGSVAEVRAGKFSIQKAPVVIANILAPVIIRLFDDGLGDLHEEGGSLILSGILAEQADGVINAAKAHGLCLKERRQMGDWVALWMQTCA